MVNLEVNNKLKIPAKVRLRRIWMDFRRKVPFLKTPHFTPEGEALIMHMKNLYRGDHAYSELTRQLVDDTKEHLKIEDDKEAIEALYLHFYAMGLVDELDLFELQQINN